MPDRDVTAAFDPERSPGMTDLMVTPESVDAYLAENPPPEDTVQELHRLLVEVSAERDEDRDHFLDSIKKLREAVSEARRELWWFIENDEPSGEVAARAIHIQDEILGKALR